MNEGLELLYVYLHDVRCYKETSITFTNDYDISYDYDTKKLLITHKQNSLKNFYGDKVKSVNLIVGKNGCGKSTLVDLLSDNLDSEKTYKWFVLFKKDNHSFYIHGRDFSLISNDEYDYSYYDYYSVNIKYDFALKQIHNLSDACEYSLTKVISSRIPRNSSVLIISDYSHSRYNNDNSIIYETITGSKLRSLYALFTDQIALKSEMYASNLKIQDCRECGFGPITEEFNIEIPNQTNLKHIQKTIHLMLDLSIHSILNKLKRNKDQVLKLPHHVRQIKENENVLIKMNELLEKLIIIRNETIHTSSIGGQMIPLEKINKLYIELIEIALTTKNKNIQDDDRLSIRCNNFDKEIDRILKLMDSIIDLSDENGLFTRNELNIKMKNISEGESIFLEMFANIYQSVTSFEYDSGNIILILDEPDKSYHPEWSAKYISMLIKLLENITDGKNIKFQIIITTHSPFMISDVPKEYITCIDIDENNKRIVSKSKSGFASNYYDIIQDSFFLTSSIGKFAEEKINKWIDEIRGLEINSDRLLELEDEMEVINDNFLRNTLRNEISKKLTKNDLSLKIQVLEKELARIKKELGESND